MALSKASYLGCALCSKALSMPPIIRSDRGFICKGCKTAGGSALNLRVYRTLEDFLLSPCRYRENGCDTQLWKIVEDHEEDCEHHRIFRCPSHPLGNCSWSGPAGFLVEHFKRYHRQDILLRSVYLSLPQNRAVKERKLLVKQRGDQKGEDIFLVQRHSDTSTGRFWYGVYYVGEPCDAENFSYILELRGASSKKTAEVYNNNNEVQWDKDLKINPNFLTEIDLESARTLLGDTNILCKVLIEEQNSKELEEEDGAQSEVDFSFK